MNIFAVDDNPIFAAQSLHDAHVIKMATESAQILSTLVHADRAEYRPDPNPPVGLKRFLLSSGKRIYNPSHANHPCTIWAGTNLANWRWLYIHAEALCREYLYRFGKVHGAREVIHALASEPPTTPGQRTPFTQAMPEAYRGADPIAAYRRYYIGDKLTPSGRPARWTRRSPPDWIPNNVTVSII